MRASFALWRVGLALALALVAGRAFADTAMAWLEKAALASRILNYSGVYVYQHGEHVEVMRVLHRVENGSEQERTEVLEGAPRQFLRLDRDVYCHLPDGRVRLEKNAPSRFFPAILPEKTAELDGQYQPELAGVEKVAGRVAQILRLKPRDGYRHAYEFWLDRRTGLPLKARVVDASGVNISMFVFSEMQIGSAPDASLFKNDLTGKRLFQASTELAPEGMWQVAPPPGFVLVQSAMRSLPGKKLPVTHQVYSDGLSALSLFIEPAADSGISFKGLSVQGAIAVYSRQIGGYKVTAMGEVPSAALIRTGNSVRRK
jgi:sigma-E factor negative regulatory protein RseB